MAKFFITGGSGFIGGHVVDRLMNEGHQITVYDNLVTGKKKWIEHHLEKKDFKFIEDDLLHFDALKEVMAGHEIVWHLGANTDIVMGNNITDYDLKNCTIGTYNILEAMRQNNIDKILFASSATVYGDAPPIHLSETYGPLLPISLYGAGKLACEGLISSYSHLFGIKAWIFRFGNVVGGKMWHGVIYDFIQKLRQNSKEMEVLGNGKQEKNYFMIEDCIDGMLCAFHKSDSACDVYNLGCEASVTVTRIAEVVAEEMGLEGVRFKYTGGARGWPGDVPVVHFDTSKMLKLGWKASKTSEEAVREAAKRLISQLT
ncbi:MAG: NAD-dependent epimerase/dehydratase family protein [Chloroflexi bacterium]|nr:NAD-dependent epimerase/dehydratase family protein [Chloroflexota bacterium]